MHGRLAGNGNDDRHEKAIEVRLGCEIAVRDATRRTPWERTTIGLIALFGICVQNDIILVAKINDLRRQGLSVHEAVLEGALAKFRPIFMTDMVMIVSVLPLALIVTTGAELHRPLAVVYIGGFFFAILLRLFVVPVLYETLARLRK